MISLPGMYMWKKLLLKLKSRLGMQILYFGQIYSNLCYGIGIWGPMVGVSHINKLIKIQNKCVSQINPAAHIADVYSTQHLLNLHQIIRLEQLKLGYKVCSHMLPPCVSKEMLTDQNSKSIVKTHTYETRKKNIPNRPNTRHHLYMSSFLYQAPLAYGNLPDKLRSIENYCRFVKECKQYLLSGNFS